MNGTLTRPNANPILSVMRDDFGSDDWGTAISWAFGVAEVLHAAGEDVPAELEFQPSPYVHVDPDHEPEEYPDAYVWSMRMNGDATVEELQFAGRCLARYLDWLRAAGRSY